MSRPRVLAAVLLGVVLFIYANSFSVGYIFDDVKVIQENETIRSLGGVAAIFGDVFTYTPLEVKGNRIDPSYRPVRFLSYAIDYNITRLLYGEFEPTNPPPTIFHLTNVLLHAACSILVLLLGRRLLGGATAAAAIAALLFATHPVHTEAVTYLSGRRDVLFTAFYLLGVLAWLRYRESGRPRDALLCGGAYLLSIFTKEMGVTLPAVLLLLEVLGVPARPEGEGAAPADAPAPARGRRGALIALFALAAAYSAWKLLVKNPGGHGEEAVPYWGGSPVVTLLTMPRVVFHYLGLLVLPVGLSADYSFDAFPVSRGLLDPPTTLLAWAGLVGIAALAVRAARRTRRRGDGERAVFPLAAGWLGLTLLPVMQIVPHPERLAERFLYLPSIGFLLLVAHLLVRFAVAFEWARLAPVAAIVIAVLLGGRTIFRNADWQDPVRLWRSVTERYPRCARAQAALGANLMDRGAYAEARPHLDACLRILPLDEAESRIRGLALGALFNRAVCSYELGEPEAALEDYRRLLREEDAFGQVLEGQGKAALIYFNLGAIHYGMGQVEDAIRHYRRALAFESNPDLAIHMREAHVHLAQIYYNAGETGRAVEEFRRALDLGAGGPREWRILFDLGEALRKEGKLADAEAIYAEAVRRGADSKEIRYRLAEVRIETDMKAAEADLLRIIEDHPRYLPALYSIADIEFRTGRYADAERHIRAVLEVDPRFGQGWDLLDAILYGQPGAVKTRERDPALLYEAGRERLEREEYREAISLFREATRVKHDFADAYCLAGICFAQLDEKDRARRVLEEAIRHEPSHVAAREALARLALEAGERDAAEGHLRAALAPAGDGPRSTSEVRRLLAGILRGRGADDEALEQLEAARSEGGSTTLLMDLLELRLDRREPAEARAVVEEIERRWPGSVEAEYARDQLGE